jgi:hypothetical protein
MVTPQKIATVSGLVGTLAAICVGAAHAEANPGNCQNTPQGGSVCIRKSETHTDKDGSHVLRQEQDCSTTDRPRLVFGEGGLTDGGSASVGQVVDCSNKADLPAGFSKPQVDF